MKWLTLGLGALALGCGAETSQPTDGMAEERVLEQMEAVLDTSTVLPLVEPKRGQLSAAAVGSHHFQGVFAAAASRCDDPPFLTITVQTDSIDMIFLLYLYDVEPTGEYRVRSSTEELFVEGEVRVGLHLIRGREGAIFRGIGGSMHLSDVDRASGHFEVTLEAVATEAVVTKVRGLFHELAVRPGDSEICALDATAFLDAEVADTAGPIPDDSLPVDSIGLP